MAVLLWMLVFHKVQAQGVIGEDQKDPPHSLISEEQVTYTFYGKKDPRLSAAFIATYISTNNSANCSFRNFPTGAPKVKLGTKVIPITNTNYSISISVFYEGNKNDCGYRFSRIELVMNRLHDEELYSRHVILSSQSKVRAIYQGAKNGFGGRASLSKPAELIANHRYFRISKSTKYICNTTYFDSLSRTIFSCRMQIRDGEGANKFLPVNKNKTKVTHPELGIDVIESDLIKLDIIADDKSSVRYTGKGKVQDFFRVLPKLNK